MPEIGTSGLMSGEGKTERLCGTAPLLDSTSARLASEGSTLWKETSSTDD